MKGDDVMQAVKQLQSTLDDFKARYGYRRYYGRIVASKINAPDIQSPGYGALSKSLKTTGGNLDKKTRVWHEKLNNDFSL